MKYCKYCGSQINDGEKCKCPQAQEHSGTFVFSKKGVFIGIVAIVILSLLGVGIVCFSKTNSKIDPFEYIEVSFSGINSMGTVEIEFKKSKIITSIIGEEPDVDDFSNGMKKYLAWEEDYEDYYDDIKMTISKEENLFNGDEITITVSVKGNAAAKIKSGKQTFKVTGLTEVETVDVFADIEFLTEGVSGSGYAQIKLLSDSMFLKSCDFNIEPKSNLKNGDKVTVTIENSDYLAEYYEKVPQIIKKEFIVSGLGEFVTSLDQLQKSTIQEIANKYLTEKRSEVVDNFLLKYSEVEYYGTYLFVRKEDSVAIRKNELRIYVYYDEFLNGQYRCTIYCPIIFRDIIVAPDGTLSLDYEDGSAATFVTDIDAAITDAKEDYYVYSTNKGISF